MARRPRICIPGIPLHIIQRGNNRQVCFGSEADFAAYASWLGEYAEEYRVRVYAWVFMTNHVHLLVTPTTSNGVPKMMQALGRQYVRYFNYTYRRSGALWEGRYKSCVIDAEQYFLVCQRYIELNPVRACMVDLPSEYSWSSYQANGLGKKISFWTPHSIYTGLAEKEYERLKVYQELFRAHMGVDDVAMIRKATNKELAIVSDRFKWEIEALSGCRVRESKRGPKSKGREFLL